MIHTVFLDIAMAMGSPAIGWIADLEGLSIVFIVSAGVTLCAAAVARRLHRSPPYISNDFVRGAA